MLYKVTLDSSVYYLKNPVNRRPQNPKGFPVPQPPDGKPDMANYLYHRTLEVKPPWGLGYVRDFKAGFIWDEENVNSLFNPATLGPLKVATAQPAGTIQYNRFQEIRGELYAMAQDKFTKVASTTATRLYLHIAADDRGLSGFPASMGAGVATQYALNSTIGVTQASTTASSANMEAKPRFGIWISPPLGAQTIAAQNWTLNIARQVDNIATSASSWGLRLYTFRPSTGAAVTYIVGSLTTKVDYAVDSENTIVATEQSYQDTAFAGGAATVQEGDVLVCEVYGDDTAGGFQPIGTLYLDGTTVTATDNTTVTNHASFIEATNAFTLSGNRPAVVAGKLVLFANPSTWTDSTVDTDTTINGVQGLIETQERVVALTQYPYAFSGGQNGRIFAGSTDGLVWNAIGPNVQNNFFYIDCVTVAGVVTVLFVNDHTYPTKWHIGTISNIDSTAAVTLATTVASRELPRGIISYPNFAGVDKPWVSAADGIYMEGVLKIRFLKPQSTFTGVIKRGMVNGLDSILYTDGPNVYMAYWADAVKVATIPLGPQKVGDGLVTAKQGDVTDFWICQERPWLVASIGGGDASHNAHVSVLYCGDGIHTPANYPVGEHRWHRPYYNSTVNRMIRGVAVSREDEGTSRLHIAEDNGVAGDVAMFLFNNFLENPTQITSYAYTTTGKFRTTRFTPTPNLQIGFFKSRFSVEGLGTTAGGAASARLTVKHAFDGGSLDAGQIIYSDSASPIAANTSYKSVWTDGAGAVGTSAFDMDEEVMAESGTTNTNSPKIHALAIAYEPKALKDDATEVNLYELEVLRDAEEYRGDGLTPEVVLANLLATFRKRTLVAFSFTERGASVAANVSVDFPDGFPMYPDGKSRLEHTTPFAPVRIRLVEAL